MELLNKLDKQGYLDYALSNGVVRSSKDITALDDGTYSVYHNIDGSYGTFSRPALLEVFEGKRDIWDADISFEQGDE